MKLKRTLAGIQIIVLMLTTVFSASGGIITYAAERKAFEGDGVDEEILSSEERNTVKNVTDYTYTIEPLLEPFNEYFFVKTDNPDPTSFRFADKSSIYSEDANISFDWDDWSEEVHLYADINYENEKTGRVNGGYIFKSYTTDGGNIILQVKSDAYNSGDNEWSDTKVNLKLPVLKDDTDYLIDTYAVKSEFFDNMDAVQAGFSSICLYSGSYVRGELKKAGLFWSLSSSPHKDQHFYMQSPYTREDNRKLFASAIYPYRYDSLGFPSVMGAVAKRLDSSASYEWNRHYHYIIDVTYKGETRTYGGSGNGEGQGISKDKVKQYFAFGKNGTEITLNGAWQLLMDYAEIEMKDDVPREDAFTWESLCNKAGSGAWVSLVDIGNVYGQTSAGYAYLYKKGDGSYFNVERAGDNGTEIYWGGDLGFASDTWVDGRYVDSWEVYVPGETFEAHPTSNILLSKVSIPQITYDYEYKYNFETGKYEYEYTNIQIVEKEKTVKFLYKDENKWIADSTAFDDGCAGYETLEDFAETGLIDNKYLDMVTLTLDEVKSLKVDKNTNTVPDNYYIYDGTADPGTEPVKLSENSIFLSGSSFTYNGKEQKPEVTVKDGNTVLKNETHYTVAYSDNINAGTAKVTITGKGKYKGSVTKTFKITPIAQSKLNVRLSDTNLTYNGKKRTPTVTVVDTSGKKLTKGTDYTVSYNSTARKKVGRYTVTVKFKGNYTGSKKLYFTITPKASAMVKAVLYGYDDVKVTWSKSTGASGYYIYYKKSTASSYTYLGTTTKTSYKKKNLADGVNYTFKVVPYYKHSNGKKYEGLAGKTASVYTLKKLGKPTISKNGSDKIQVKWKNISGESGYQISCSTSKTGTKIVTTYATTKGASKKIKVTKGKTYYYKVRAYYETADGVKVYGPWSKTKSYKLK